MDNTTGLTHWQHAEWSSKPHYTSLWTYYTILMKHSFFFFSLSAFSVFSFCVFCSFFAFNIVLSGWPQYNRSFKPPFENSHVKGMVKAHGTSMHWRIRIFLSSVPIVPFWFSVFTIMLLMLFYCGLNYSMPIEISVVLTLTDTRTQANNTSVGFLAMSLHDDVCTHNTILVVALFALTEGFCQ